MWADGRFGPSLGDSTSSTTIKLKQEDQHLLAYNLICLSWTLTESFPNQIGIMMVEINL
jgi:hypothetical protein